MPSPCVSISITDTYVYSAMAGLVNVCRFVQYTLHLHASRKVDSSTTANKMIIHNRRIQ